MWNENIEFYARLARPKPGVRFENNNEQLRDLQDAVSQANAEWNGERIFDILDHDGISVKMAYRALDPIKNRRTLTRHLQTISQILAHEKNWNENVTRKENTIFTVDLIGDQYSGRSELNSQRNSVGDDETPIKNLLVEILDVLGDIRDELRNRD